LKAEEYHKKQFAEIKRGTVAFVDWLESNVELDNKTILDMACGGGANVLYLGGRHKTSKFVGIDYDKEVLSMCQYHLNNVVLEYGDWYHMDSKYKNYFNGIMNFQTLVSMDDYKMPIRKLCELQPDWIALTSLFYEGRINFYTIVDDHEGDLPCWGLDGKAHYNVYSLPLVQELFAEYGYKQFLYKKFEMDVDLPKPKNNDMGTYTVMTKDNERLQISGALLMPWYFIIAKK